MGVGRWALGVGDVGEVGEGLMGWGGLIGCWGSVSFIPMFFILCMARLLDSVQNIELKVIEYKDIIWEKNINEYTLNKENFRTDFNCPDSHCETVSILDKISQLIAPKVQEETFLMKCPGKDEIGRSCIAGLKFTVKIAYID
ncbi:MAG: hypothetical protein ACYT04_30460 [Nostoc sp.]